MQSILNVLYQSNDNYASITGISITSLLENNKDLEYIYIYILNDNISSKNLKKLQKLCDQYKRDLIIVDTKKILQKLIDLKVSPFKNTYTTYFKLVAVKNLKIKGDRILQLDGDTIINKSLRELCTMDLNDCLIAATYDCTMNDYKKLIDIPLTDEYYNCGVLLINQKNWIKEECEEKIIDHLKSVRNGYYTVDQDILNVLFRHRFKYLNLTYNFNSGFYIYGIKESLKMYDLKDEYFDTYEDILAVHKDPVIYHCMGAMTGRPWEENSIHPQNEIFDKYKRISPWKSENKRTPKRKMIFRLQRILYQILPRNLYIPFHQLAQHKYLSDMNKKVNKE